MGDIKFGGESYRVGEFAEVLIAGAQGEHGAANLEEYSRVIAGLDDDTACQLRVAVDAISELAVDERTGHYLVAPELQESVTSFLESNKAGVSTCDLKEFPEISSQDMDMRIDGMKL